MPLLFTKFSSYLLEDRELCQRYIEQFVQLAAPRSKEMREKNQYNLVECNSDLIVDLALKNALPQPIFASPDKVSNELSMISNSMEKEYEIKSKCFFDNVSLAEKPFLLVGEEIVSERFTFLEQPFKRYAEGTCAFVRETNYSEFCFLIPGHYFMHSEVRVDRWKDLIRIEEPDIPRSRLVRETSVKDIGKLLGEGLLGGIMGNIATAIFNDIFPTDMTNFIDAVYKEIQRIVHDELTDVIIDQINGRIYGTESWVRNTYTPIKDSGNYTGEELTALLVNEENDLATEVIGPLQEERFAKPGVCVFMIGAGMHLAILQELAYVDPQGAASDSAFVESIKKWAKQYADFAKATTDAVVNERLGYITSKSDHLYDSTDGSYYYEYWMYDSFDQTSGEHYMFYFDAKGDEHGDLDADKHVEADIKARKNSVKADLLNKMSDPYATADDWYKLIDQPLPE